MASATTADVTMMMGSWNGIADQVSLPNIWRYLLGAPAAHFGDFSAAPPRSVVGPGPGGISWVTTWSKRPGATEP